MTFAGGPLNNFVLQAVAKMASVLRADPASHGLVTAVSGILTKQGVSLWSGQEPEVEFGFFDVTEQTAHDQPPVPLVESFDGPAHIAGYTVLFEGERAVRTAFVCDLDDGRRTLAASDDPALAELGTQAELCGRGLRLAGGRATLA
jgi:acetyl-CoA C-acetyltransferase